MTRFARAKGSKASNERLPNEATPWHVMKEQLVENLNNPQQQKDKVKSAKELLEEKETPFYYDTVGNVNTDWAEFENTESKKNNVDSNTKSNKEKKKTGKKSVSSESTTGGNKEAQENKGAGQGKAKKDSGEVCIPKNVKVKKSPAKSEVKQKVCNGNASKTLENYQPESEATSKLPMKKRKRQEVTSGMSNDNVNNSTQNEVTESIEAKTENSPSEKKQKKKKKKKGMSNALRETETNGDVGSSNLESDKSKSAEATEENPQNKNNQSKLTKRQKRNMKLKSKKSNETNSQNLERPNVTEETQENDTNPNNTNKETTINNSKQDNNNKTFNNLKRDRENMDRRNVNENNAKKRKAPKIRDDKEHKRRKPIPESRKMVINGVEIEMVMYDGFPVKKEDADRLKELKKKMIMKGIPKSEIAAAMKLERRKAEKALARVRKLVCYHCRKSGHNLSDCPELGAEQAGTGICFKCGSTEHTHFECKVTKAAEYRHATCFICREQGHIAKQCPDNPKGIYPQGGACKVCGDVTHLKKDCPDLAQQKEEATITVDTIANSNLESLEEDSTRQSQTSNKKNRPNKVVKF